MRSPAAPDKDGDSNRSRNALITRPGEIFPLDNGGSTDMAFLKNLKEKLRKLSYERKAAGSGGSK